MNSSVFRNQKFLMMASIVHNQKNSALLLIIFLLFISSCQKKPAEPKKVKNLPIIPMPVSLEDQRGSFALDQNTVILLGNADPKLAANAAYMKDVVETMTGLNMEVSFAGNEARGIFLSSKEVNKDLGEEGYDRFVNPLIL